MNEDDLRRAEMKWAMDAYSGDYSRRGALNLFAQGGLFAGLSGLLASLPQMSYAQEDEKSAHRLFAHHGCHRAAGGPRQWLFQG